jgi:hypothetical protein
MLAGSCLSGRVAYEVDAAPGPIIHCHCQTCRKTHGSAFSSLTNVPREHFRFVRGEELLNAFESSAFLAHFRRRAGRALDHFPRIQNSIERCPQPAPQGAPKRSVRALQTP